MKLEKTFVLVKPDGIQKKLVGEIISRFEKAKLRICALKMLKVSKKLGQRHYAEHKGASFYNPLIKFITTNQVVAMVLEGKNAVKKVRGMIGPTDSKKAQAGTIRGDFGKDIRYNIVHGAVSLEKAKKEMMMFFRLEEIY